MTSPTILDHAAVLFGAIGFLLAGPGIAVGIVSWGRRKLERERRSPLTTHMLRGPGETLRSEIDRLGDRIDVWLMYLFFLPSLAALLVLVQAHVFRRPIDLVVVVVMGVIVAAGMVLFGRLCIADITKLRKLRLGLDGEIAVGQELQNLMLQGARVFHDFPAEGFNIDHIVIGPGGVAAVETKARSKPNAPVGQRQDTVRIVYDGKSLKFPDHTETEPVEQAVRQAQWLSRWLSSAVGWHVEVTPALAIPGWFIEHRAFEPVRVFNGKNPNFLIKPRRGQALDASQIQAIAHQVEQRCRNVEPNFLPKQQGPSGKA